MTGNLHDHGVHATLHHLGQQLLQSRRLGCGQSAGDILAVDAYPNRADETDPLARRPQPCLDQIGGRGLPGGPGDTDHLQLAGRLPVDLRRERTEHRARYGMDQYRDIREIRALLGQQLCPGDIREHSSSPRSDRLGRELCAMCATTGQRREEVTRPRVLGPQRDAGDGRGTGPTQFRRDQ